MDKKQLAKLVIGWVIDKAKELAAADGVTDWKDYAAGAVEALWAELNPLLGATGDKPALAAAAADFVAGLEDA